MRPLFQARLVNAPFGDPGLLVDFSLERRALLCDLGELGSLAPRDLLRVSHVFVSHTHMDHFVGFDRLLRVSLGREAEVRLFGPPGFVAQVEHKLAAYTWNLADTYPGDFTLLAHEVDQDGECASARFRCRNRFAREALAKATRRRGVLADEARFRVRSTMLEHRTPSLAFSIEEKTRVNVRVDGLADMGLSPGAWLNELKRAVREDQPDDAPVRAWREEGGEVQERHLPLGVLRQRVLSIEPGRKVCYVTDVIYNAENARRIVELARGADELFIESVFLDEDAEHAREKAHLTARQAGGLARAAGVRRVIPFHFSPRYTEREAELRAELENAFQDA